MNQEERRQEILDCIRGSDTPVSGTWLAGKCGVSRQIVFGNPGLNAGGVKEKHSRFCLINPLADRFSQVSKPVKHGL